MAFPLVSPLVSIWRRRTAEQCGRNGFTHAAAARRGCALTQLTLDYMAGGKVVQ